MEMVDSVDELINPRVQFKGFLISQILSCWTRQLFPEFPVQEEGQSGGTESSERGPVSTRKTDRLHDLRLRSSHWCS